MFVIWKSKIMLFFLYGTDIWSKNQKLRQITQKFIKSADPSRMNLLTLESGQIDDDQIRAVITASPFMARKRMVVIKNTLTGIRRKSLHELLLEILMEIKEYTIVVISEDDARPKKWSNQALKTLWEYLEKNAEKEEFKSLWGIKLESVISKQAKEQGLTLQKDAIALLAMLSGGDLGYVEKELEKLAAYMEAEPHVALTAEAQPPYISTITAGHIKLLCADHSEANIFNFLDALGSKDRQAILHAFAEQLQEDDPLALTARAVGHIRALLMIKIQGQAGARALRLHPFQSKKISAQMRNWKAEDLKRFMFQLMALDYGAKQGLIADPSTQLAVLLARITSL